MNKDMVLLRAVEMAAIASYKYIGKKDKNALDGAAVEAMDFILNNNPGIKLRVVNGEGELDEAPRLYVGQILGDVNNPHAKLLDISVDPVEGTNPAAYNFAGSIATIAASRAGTMVQLPEMYMEKFFVSPGLAKYVDFNQPTIETIVQDLQKKLGKKTLKAIILDKPRHEKIIKKLDDLGIIVRLIKDGDVLGAIDVVNGEADFVYGIGGAPEAVLMASLAIASGSEMRTKLIPYQVIWPNDKETKERQKIEEDWLKQQSFNWNTYLMAADLVKDPNTRFFAAGITAGGTLKPIDYVDEQFFVNTFMASHGIVRDMNSIYDVNQINHLRPEIKYLFDKYRR